MRNGRKQTSYSILLSTKIDRKPVVVRREDGFEKRILMRCGRCRLVIGYRLDGEGQDGRKERERERVVYLLPGGLMETEDMVAGRAPVREEDWAGGG